MRHLYIYLQLRLKQLKLLLRINTHFAIFSDSLSFIIWTLIVLFSSLLYNYHQIVEKKENSQFHDADEGSNTLSSRPWRWRSGLKRSPLKRNVGCSNLSRDGPKLRKQVVTCPLLNARQQVWVSHVLGDDHYKRKPRVTVGVAR